MTKTEAVKTRSSLSCRWKNFSTSWNCSIMKMISSNRTSFAHSIGELRASILKLPHTHSWIWLIQRRNFFTLQTLLRLANQFGGAVFRVLVAFHLANQEVRNANGISTRIRRSQFDDRFDSECCSRFGTRRCPNEKLSSSTRDEWPTSFSFSKRLDFLFFILYLEKKWEKL